MKVKDKKYIFFIVILTLFYGCSSSSVSDQASEQRCNFTASRRFIRCESYDAHGIPVVTKKKNVHYKAYRREYL